MSNKMTQHEADVEPIRNLLKEMMHKVRAETSIEKIDALWTQVSLDSVIRLANWIKKDIENRIK